MTQFCKLVTIISIFCVGLLSGCILEPQGTQQIVYPLTGVTVYEGDSITLISEGAFQEVVWQSSIQGEIGRGVKIDAILELGTHEITIIKNSTVLHSISISVITRTVDAGGYFSFPLLGLDQSLHLSAGTYTPVGISFSGDGKNLSISIDPAAESASLDILTGDGETDTPLRDITFDWEPSSDISAVGSSSSKSAGSKAAITYELNQTKTFRVADISRSNALNVDPLYVTAEAIRISEEYILWLDTQITYGGDYNASAIDDIWNDLNSTALPRTKAVWGSPGDINNDGTVSILLTDVLNMTNVAVGFFNPADYSTWNSVTNPTSNMMEVVYVGVPDSSDTNFIRESIVATIAHEMQHLILYYNKTYLGQTETPETIYLNEGLSHLTENLCGYGISGGNINFAKKYLQNPSFYSLKYANGAGSYDSSGLRGGMSLFLYWLFEKKGGAVWEDNGSITDNGGLAVLRAIAQASKTGWEAIEEAAGETAESLLTQWAMDIQAIAAGSKTKPPSIIDPVTGEEVSLHPFLGTVTFSDGTNYVFNGPERQNYNSDVVMLPYSVSFWNPVTVVDKRKINITESGSVDLAKLFFFRNQ